MTPTWIRLGGELVYDAGIFRLCREKYAFRGSETRPFYVLEASAWANIVAVTEGSEIVLVRQFRHGVRGSSLEVPGGIVDASDRDPAAAAARELREETGYAAGSLAPLGTVSSNPAILSNRTHFFVARDAELAGEPAPDDHEDLEVVLAPEAAILPMIQAGEIHHSLSVAALTLYLLAARQT